MKARLVQLVSSKRGREMETQEFSMHAKNGIVAGSLLSLLTGAALCCQGAAHAADAPAPVKAGSTAKAKQAPKKTLVRAQKVEEESAPTVSVTDLDATIGKSNLVNLSVPIARISVGNPAVADVILLSPKQLYILGKTIGSTNVVMWDKQGHTIAMVDVNVSRELGALNAEIKKLLPKGNLKVRSMGENVVLEGHVPDARIASQVSDLAEAFVGKKVINMMHVDGVQQVMLEVKVAEINRTLLDKLGVKFGLSHPTSGGGIGYTILGDFLSNAITGSVTSVAPTLSGSGFTNPSISSNIASGPGLLSLAQPGATNKLLNIDALKQDGLIKILAEPNIVALSGQEGSFLAGGEILIPVQQGLGTVSLESKQFGVGLRFTPTVLEDGRIQMRVLPEVTDVIGFTSVTTTGSGGAVLVPTLTTRRASTTVELREGQSLAIGGLLQSKVNETINRLPLLGEIPILGALFRSSEYQTDKTELMIVVTPRLVKPLAPNYKLPTDSFKEPTRSEFFLEGRMESKPENPPATAPAKPEAPAAPAEEGHQLK